MKRIAIPLASIQSHDLTRSTVTQVQAVCLTVVLALGGVTLANWVIPPLEGILPHFFLLMRANTSLLIVLCGLAFTLYMPQRSNASVSVARLLSAIVVGFAQLILLKDFGLIDLRIETLLAPDAGSMYPGKVSPEAAFIFLLLGLILFGLRARKSLLSYLIDGTLLLLCLVLLVLLARYFFGLSHLFVLYQNNPVSLQTLICLLALAILVGTRRAEYGLFAILLDGGSGGMIARLAVPVAVLLPFVVAVPKALLVRVNPASESSSTAFATSILSIGATCLVLLLAWRTKAFEATVRELSLRDELTGLYNRRGLYLLAEQALQLSQRVDESFSALFFDLDNLKQVNDAFGHDVGSLLLKEMADLLVHTFRKTDVIGRVGGDEFVVAGQSDDPEMENAIHRFGQAVAQANALPNRRYLLSFSMGSVASRGDAAVTLEELLAKADAIMYENKRRKKNSPLVPALLSSA